MENQDRVSRQGLSELIMDLLTLFSSHTDRVMISTGQRGGVRVVDLNTGQVLWRIPRNLTRHFPHVEYDRRCLIFDRIGQGRLDVWRQHRLNDPGSEEDQAIGTFTFYTSLPSDRPTRAFRFQYPVLAVATQDGYVLLWDIETQKITQEMTLAGSMHIDGNINYIGQSLKQREGHASNALT